MVEEARLEQLDAGLTPVSDGWFVVNVRDGAWVTNEALGARTLAWRGRRDGDDLVRRGVRPVPEVAARAAGRLERASLGLSSGQRPSGTYTDSCFCACAIARRASRS